MIIIAPRGAKSYAKYLVREPTLLPDIFFQGAVLDGFG